MSSLRHLGWLVLVAALVVWAFILGILVGQGALLSPSQTNWLRTTAAGLPGVGAFFVQDQAAKEKALRKPQLSFHQELQSPQKPGKAPPTRQPAKTARPKAPAPTPPAQGMYTVQVASLNQMAQAEAMVQRLREAGLPAYVRRTKVKGVGLRYRVRVGSYQNKTQAQSAAGRIRLKQRLAAYVTKVD